MLAYTYTYQALMRTKSVINYLYHFLKTQPAASSQSPSQHRKALPSQLSPLIFLSTLPSSFQHHRSPSNNSPSSPAPMAQPAPSPPPLGHPLPRGGRPRLHPGSRSAPHAICPPPPPRPPRIVRHASPKVRAAVMGPAAGGGGGGAAACHKKHASTLAEAYGRAGERT